MLSKIAVIEPDSSLREAIAALVESMGHEVSRFDSLDDYFTMPDQQEIAALVVNAKHDGVVEFERLLPMIQRQPNHRVVLLTDGTPTSMVVRAMRSGLSNLLEHPFPFIALREAIADAIQEHAKLLQAQGKQIAPEISELLTPQEEDIAVLMLEGASVKEIASKLDVSVRTIHYRKNEIYQKIGVTSRSQAIQTLKFKKMNSRLPA